MSHQATPNLHPKRAPNAMSSDTPGQPPNGDTSANMYSHMDLSRSVTDSTAANAKQLLNAYIYDFLIKNTLPHTARLFVNEADLPSIPNGSLSSSSKASPQINTNSTSSTPRNSNLLLDELHLPKLALSMDAPQGFLFEWCQVFWDVFNARNDKASSQLAAQYYQMQLMKQRQHHEILGMELLAGANPQMQQPSVPQPVGQAPQMPFSGPNPLGQQVPVMHPNQQVPMQMMGMNQQLVMLQSRNPQAQAAMQRQMMVDPRQQQRYLMMMKQQQQNQAQPGSQLQATQQHSLQPNLQPNLQPGLQANLQPPLGNTPMMSQDSLMPMAGMNMGMNMSIPQQMFMQQQQQQQQQQQLNASNSHPQHPQLQLQLLQNPQMLGPQGQQLTPQTRIQEQAQTQMNNLRQHAAVSAQSQPNQMPPQMAHQSMQAPNSAASQPQSRESSSPLPGNMNAPRGKQQGRPIRPPQNQNMMPYQQPSMDGSVGSPLAMGNPPAKPGSVQTIGPKNPQGQPNRNSNALQDYQMQLMMLEKQNKKRLDIARNTGGQEMNGMPVQLPLGGMQMENQAPPKASPAPSPHLNSNPSPMSGAAKPKKAQPGKKGRKPNSGANGAASVTATPNQANGVVPQNGKKDSITPLTPAAETDITSKKKRKSSTAKSPAKKPATVKEVKEEGPKKESDDKFDPEIMEAGSLDKKPEFPDDNSSSQPSSMYFQSLGGNDKMISVDILGGSGNGDGSHLFNSGGNSGMVDIDFEFNNLLDSGDGGLNDSITGFNWGNPIEGSD